MNAAPGTPGAPSIDASLVGGAVPDTMSGATVAPQVAPLPPVQLVLLPLRTQRPRLLLARCMDHRPHHHDDAGGDRSCH